MPTACRRGHLNNVEVENQKTAWEDSQEKVQKTPEKIEDTVIQLQVTASLFVC